MKLIKKYTLTTIACVIAFVNINAQVSIGKMDNNPRGVLDVNNANGYSNTSGIVLPVAENISDVLRPDGTDAMHGTIAFDATKNCVRIMTTHGWSNCLLDEGGFRSTVANILSVGADFKIRHASMSQYITLVIGHDDRAIYVAGRNTGYVTGLGRNTGRIPSFLMVFASPCLDVSAGTTHSIAVDVLGQVWTWGSNANYRTGLPDDAAAGNTGNTGTPNLVTNAAGDPMFCWRPTAVLGEAIQCEANSANSYVLTKDGRIYTVGGNTPNGTGAIANTWTQITAGLPLYTVDPVVYIASSDNSCGAVTKSGKVYVWGVGATGKLGTGATANVATPVQINIPDNTPIGKIAMGYYSGAAISQDSKNLYVWGRNNALGAAGTIVIAPTKVTTLPGFVEGTDTLTSIAAGRYNYGNGGLTAITSIGVFTTGENTYGQMGIGSTTDQTTWLPIKTTGVVRGTNFVDAEMSGFTTLLLTGENIMRAESSYVGYGMGYIDYRNLGAITTQPRVPSQLTK
ncbi:MAG: hypothetical protein FWD66_02035 [Paludibacter sp.]|nr:hypothetical protein [Paludibacter sp.]